MGSRHAGSPIEQTIMRDGNYEFCPYCATNLQVRDIYNQQRPVCPQCGFVHFLDPKVAVIGLVTHNQRVLLIQRAINPEKGKWALPGGYMDAGEMPDAALQRELLEEVNLAIHVTELLTIFPMVPHRAPDPQGQIPERVRSQGIVLAYRAQVADPAVTALVCADDACAADWFAPTDIPQNLAFESTQTLLNAWLKEL